MKLDRRNLSARKTAALRDRIAPLLKSVDALPAPCVPCCPLDRPTDCSPHCPNMPRALSSDPEDHPLEPGIAPLVYEVSRLGVFETCWSCEGHNGPDGTLWKTPKVWFRAEAQVHLTLLARCLAALRQGGELGAPWQVTLISADQADAEALFCIEPRLEHPSASGLADLQADVRTLAARLPALISQQARRTNATL